MFSNPRLGRFMSKWKSLLITSAAVFLVLLVLVVVNKARATARQAQSNNNLKQIWFCMSNYDSAQGRLPSQAFGFGDGAGQLSWRLAIQPYYSGDPLYNLFKLGEPWNSPSNLKWTTHNAGFLNVPGNDAMPGLTPYKVYFGEQTAFAMIKNDDCNLQCNRWSLDKLKATPRGCTNLILCVETGFPVIWSKPEDIAYDPNAPIPEWKPLHQDFGSRQGVLTLLADGNVTFLRKSLGESVLRACIEPESASQEILPP